MNTHLDLQNAIDSISLETEVFKPKNLEAIETVIHYLNNGELRVCEKINNVWTTHEWIKKTILLYFKTKSNTMLLDMQTHYFDKIHVLEFQIWVKIIGYVKNDGRGAPIKR